MKSFWHFILPLLYINTDSSRPYAHKAYLLLIADKDCSSEQLFSLSDFNETVLAVGEEEHLRALCFLQAARQSVFYLITKSHSNPIISHKPYDLLLTCVLVSGWNDIKRLNPISFAVAYPCQKMDCAVWWWSKGFWGGVGSRKVHFKCIVIYSEQVFREAGMGWIQIHEFAIIIAYGCMIPVS